MVQDITLVYMVAGLSSRFGGRPKPLISVGPRGESLIEVSLDQALPSGFARIVFVVSDATEPLFKKKFGQDYRSIPIAYARQTFDSSLRDKPWGTVDSLCAAMPLLNGPFVVCNGDDLYGVETFSILTHHLREHSGDATVGYNLGETLPLGGKVNRGIFSASNGFVTNIREELSIPTDALVQRGLSRDSLCSMNIFALSPPTLKLLYDRLTSFKTTYASDRVNECILPVELGHLVKEGLPLKLYPTPGQWLGVTNPADEEIVRNTLRTS